MNTTPELTIEDLDQELAEQLPARDLMCCYNPCCEPSCCISVCCCSVEVG